MLGGALKTTSFFQKGGKNGEEKRRGREKQQAETKYYG